VFHNVSYKVPIYEEQMHMYFYLFFEWKTTFSFVCKLRCLHLCISKEVTKHTVTVRSQIKVKQFITLIVLLAMLNSC